MMRKLIGCAAALVMGFGLSGAASAEQVTKWVDENGVVQFGNAQFAPPGQGEQVTILPANGAELPEAAPQANRRAGGQFVLVQHTQVKNPNGFRGHNNRPRARRANGGRSRF